MYVRNTIFTFLSGTLQGFQDRTDFIRVLWLIGAVNRLFHDGELVHVVLQLGDVGVVSLVLQLLCRVFCQKHPYGFMLDHRGVQNVWVEVVKRQL